MILLQPWPSKIQEKNQNQQDLRLGDIKPNSEQILLK